MPGMFKAQQAVQSDWSRREKAVGNEDISCKALEGILRTLIFILGIEPLETFGQTSAMIWFKASKDHLGWHIEKRLYAKQEQKQGFWLAFVVIWVRTYDRQNQSGNSKDGERWSDLGQILNLKLMQFLKILLLLRM